MGRRHLVRMVLVAAAVGSAALALASGCTPGGGPPGQVGLSGSVTGSAGTELYATPAGVIWSFTPDLHLGQVARSKDGGRTWRAVLPGSGPHTGLAMNASFFLGPDLGWAMHEVQRPDALGYVTTVFGTSDGGQHWWRSAPLPGEQTGCCTAVPDEVYFADPRNGWVYAGEWMDQNEGDYQVEEQLWRTTDGGHTWALVHARLPLQDAMDQGDETCLAGGPFHVAFANQQDGWLTAGTCATVGYAPRVWRTSDGGRTWTPAALPAPPGGWPTAQQQTYSGVGVGLAWVVSSAGHAVVLVAAAYGAELDIEASGDGGRSWHLASRVAAGSRGYANVAWFEPVDADRWVVNAPGEVIQTANAGRTWHVTHSAQSASGLPGGPFWFTSLSQAYARGSGGVTLATSDGGRTWTTAAAPPPERPVPGPAVTMVQEISPGFAVASGPQGLRVSRDGGRTWRPLPAVPGPHPLGLTQFPDSRTGFTIDHFGKQLWRTTDGGSSWVSIPEPPRVQIDHVEFWTPAAGVAVAGTNGVYRTTNGGASWQPLSLPRTYFLAPFNRIDQLAASYPRQGEYPVNQSTCFAGGRTSWATTASARATGGEAVLVSTDGGTTWHVTLTPTVLRSPTVHARLTAWLGGCRGSQAWVELMVVPYGPGLDVAYDLLHTSDYGRTWQDVLRIPNGATISRLKLPMGPGALGAPPLPAGLALIPEPLALTPTGAWLTLVTGGGLVLAVTADGGQHWQIRWFPAPRHDPRAAPASPSVFPAGLPWLATTATDSRHAWVLFASTNGSGASYLYATSDGGATWTRITTFR